ncbi:hypothetical protein RirG_056460 [Rhizophagus irregularis DAOM 197198w]|uniref:Uncharacterized protein n=1 Tax=Rhizophagus irregularis (strain DAOM 197198w) TaxID=1432141 RepID=A0A015N409_RHIIW|nr:hypothetical protein RirG_056460 [Rhizophagus irregularis DAOM 197198w]
MAAITTIVAPLALTIMMTGSLAFVTICTIFRTMSMTSSTFVTLITFITKMIVFTTYVTFTFIYNMTKSTAAKTSMSQLISNIIKFVIRQRRPRVSTTSYISYSISFHIFKSFRQF